MRFLFLVLVLAIVTYLAYPYINLTWVKLRDKYKKTVAPVQEEAKRTDENQEN